MLSWDDVLTFERLLHLVELRGWLRAGAYGGVVDQGVESAVLLLDGLGESFDGRGDSYVEWQDFDGSRVAQGFEFLDRGSAFVDGTAGDDDMALGVFEEEAGEGLADA